MKFTTLNQTIYKDSQGNNISAEKVDFISPYKHIIDGFYEWECGKCGLKHSNRAGWSISGQVLECKCGAMNLLVKTNTDEINKWMGANITLEELERSVKEKEQKLDQYVLKSSIRWVADEYEKFIRAQQDWNNALVTLKQAIEPTKV